MGVAGLIYGPDTGHLSEYGGRDDEDVVPREHDAAVLKKKLRENTPLVPLRLQQFLLFRDKLMA
jgi:hypothetical protein